MLEAASRKVRGGCMMVMQQTGETVTFRGTAFLVHPAGYLLTTTEVADAAPEPLLVPERSGEDFSPLLHESVAPLAASVVSRDDERHVALLKLEDELPIVVPDHLLGRPDQIVPGNSVLALGYSYGHLQLHGLMGASAVVSSKVRSANETNLIMYDHPALPGDIGGPLVNAADARVVGIIGGPFDPGEVTGTATTTPAHHAFAISVEYGVALLEAAGVEVV